MIALIPARGGSKGIENKNIQDLGGKPLIAHTIESALASPSIDRVVVSTDSDRISKVAIQYGAEMPFLRPRRLASDNSLAIDTYIYTIDKLNKIENNKYDDLIVLLPTCPFRSKNHIEDAHDMFVNKQADSVISIGRMTKPIEWLLEIDDRGILRQYNNWKEGAGNRQDATFRYAPNGSIYILKCSMLKKTRSYYTDQTYGYLMDKISSIDIDEPEDLHLARLIWEGINAMDPNN